MAQSAQEQAHAGEASFQAQGYSHNPDVAHLASEWGSQDKDEPQFQQYDARTPTQVALEDKTNGRPRGGRGVAAYYTDPEKNFILASRMAYGSNSGRWDIVATGLKKYIEDDFPHLKAKLPIREKRSISERWHQSRGGIPVNSTLEQTWRETYDTPKWEKERERISKAGYFEGAPFPKDWEDRNGTYSRHR
ncbi:hypothetical protein Dda_6747 [Drechslerella dactyloides]|uniref:Uncharacterized protein n=1 Tax=Drechslerella dactyloides TaxID=74499 RepID=A0AAD6NJ66_DREDA|nr:hypothetical protein Dda_6747 [Drechslerella dactyloides]